MNITLTPNEVDLVDMADSRPENAISAIGGPPTNPGPFCWRSRCWDSAKTRSSGVTSDKETADDFKTVFEQ